MCGRYTLAIPVGELVQLFDVHRNAVGEFPPRYNVAPSQQAPVVVADADGRRHMGLLRWGLIPSWAKDPSLGSRLINARGETAATKPSFRDAFRRRRCLVPVDGFYEWRSEGEKAARTPFLIRPVGGGVLALAGVWERWKTPEDDPVATFAILTRPATPWMSRIHGRMPVIISPSAWGEWLEPTTPVQGAQDLVLRSPVPPLEAREVSRVVNNPAHDEPGCAEPLPGGEFLAQESEGVADA